MTPRKPSFRDLSPPLNVLAGTLLPFSILNSWRGRLRRSCGNNLNILLSLNRCCGTSPLREVLSVYQSLVAFGFDENIRNISKSTTRQHSLHSRAVRKCELKFHRTESFVSTAKKKQFMAIKGMILLTIS